MWREINERLMPFQPKRSRVLNFLLGCKLALLRQSEVARFDGIVVVDLRESEHFRECVLASLDQVKSCDPYRFRRIQRRLTWILNCTLSEAGRAQYNHDLRLCEIDFDESRYESDRELSVGSISSVLVHEATHGTIRAQGILYTPKLRSRIERLCVAEEHHFLERLAESQGDLAVRLRRDFVESDWHPSWNATLTQTLYRIFRRLLTQR